MLVNGGGVGRAVAAGEGKGGEDGLIRSCLVWILRRSTVAELPVCFSTADSSTHTALIGWEHLRPERGETEAQRRNPNVSVPPLLFTGTFQEPKGHLVSSAYTTTFKAALCSLSDSKWLK